MDLPQVSLCGGSNPQQTFSNALTIRRMSIDNKRLQTVTYRMFAYRQNVALGRSTAPRCRSGKQVQSY